MEMGELLMANVLVQESSLQAIADAIRAKNRSRNTYTPAEMAPAIRNIPSGGGGEAVLIPKTITENGVSHAVDDEADGYSDVTVAVHPGLLTPHFFDMDTGYVERGEWHIGSATVCYTVVYEVEAGKGYLVMVGGTVGTRFRVMFSEEDTTTATDTVIGTNITNTNNPAPYFFRTYTAPSDGYITITKDNAGRADLKTFVFDLHGLADGNE